MTGRPWPIGLGIPSEAFQPTAFFLGMPHIHVAIHRAIPSNNLNPVRARSSPHNG